MQISVKIPKGVSEEDLMSLNFELSHLFIQPMKIEISKRTIRVDTGTVQQYNSAEAYMSDTRDAFNIISDFVTSLTYGQ